MVVAGLFVLIGYFLTHPSKEKIGNWFQFYSKGKEAGFSSREVDQLKRLAVSCNIYEPLLIFTSQKQLDICIRYFVRSARDNGEIDEPSAQEFLSNLFDYCKKIEMEAAENKVRITTSRQISEGQHIKILVPGTGVFKSEVVKNFGNYLTVSRPVNSKITTALQWHGLKISIYFWREDDAGYVFDTEVMDEVFSKGISSLKIDHCDELFRTQKRRSMRIKLQKPAYIYTVKETDLPDILEKSPGLKCMMEDISDTGCAFRVKGHASAGLRLKVQLMMDRAPICMPGTVRSVDYNEEHGTSLIHMEADPLPHGTRNRILCEVFHMLPDEDEDELPFRVLEEEIESTGAQAQVEDPSGRFREAI